MRGANWYRWRFVATCPVNGRTIAYLLTIETEDAIPVEAIVAATTDLGEAYHEDLADRLFERFGGRQELVAYHHGVEILTVREPSPAGATEAG